MFNGFGRQKEDEESRLISIKYLSETLQIFYMKE